jgi:hypothetical protein
MTQRPEPPKERTLMLWATRWEISGTSMQFSQCGHADAVMGFDALDVLAKMSRNFIYMALKRQH